MTSVEARGKTVDEAIAAALSQLGVPRERVRVEVLEEANKGLFGVFGGRSALVRVTVTRDKAAVAAELLQQVASAMDLQVTVTTEDVDGETQRLDISGSDLGVLIGHHGQTLDALQYWLNVAVAKQVPDQPVRLVVDVEGYRRRREESLQRLASRLAEKARRTGREVELEPMTAHDRRVIHLALQDHPDIETRSVGEEPHRKVVIAVRKATR